MTVRSIVEALFRAHSNDVDPKEASSKTGRFRFDDYRASQGEETFHILYVGESIAGCLIEKLQRFTASNADAHAILAAVTSEVDNDQEIVANSVPASVLRDLAVSQFEVLDPTAKIVEATDPDTLTSVHLIGTRLGIDGLPEPPIKAGTILGNDYSVPQRMSVIVEQAVAEVVGIRYRSALDDPHNLVDVHMNVALYRKLPSAGGDLRVALRRVRTGLAVPDHRAELEDALRSLRAATELPLDHPDVTAIP